MLNLREYRDRTDRLADHLPWAALVAPGIVLNKDGSFQRSFAFRGPDLESATDGELVGACARANNVLKRFGSGWALFFEASRSEAIGYPSSSFPDPISHLVDLERRADFEAAGQHFESRYHMTLMWLPPADSSDAIGRTLIDRPDAEEARDWRAALQRFTDETDRALDLFAGFMPHIRALSDAETLTYLHGTISPHRQRIAVPDVPMYLDAVLADTPLVGGLEPKLGEEHLRTVTILGFPPLSRPAILDALNHQNFAYRWVSRFIPLDKSEASKALTSLRRQWFNKRKSITALLREVLYNQTAQLLDSDADNKVIDADQALQALGGDLVSFGYLTITITVSDTDRNAVDEKIRAVERIINGLGFSTIREGVNAVEAWMSSIPGNAYANVRQPLVHSLNIAHLMPLAGIWAGPSSDAHLDGPVLLTVQAAGNTPFRLSAHVGDVGHMIVVGPTGAGKSVLLALMAMQFRRYADAQVYIIDKGYSARAATIAMGGIYHSLGADHDAGLSFQPLRRIDDDRERAWASDWIAALLAHEKLLVTPEVKEALWSALTSLASAPVDERTLTGLSLLLQSNPIRSALGRYTLDGAFGALLDAAEQDLAFSDVQCFETEELMGQESIVAPVLSYIFHRLEARFNGRPTLLILDEAWLFLDHPLFAAQIREWLKTLRKKNVSVVFATQSLADIADSSIAPAIIESCPQRIFLPNDRAIEPQCRAAYERFGLNNRQIELIGMAVPKRQYYLQSARGNRLFELGLGPIALSLCGMSSADDQRHIDVLLAEHGPEEFGIRLLEAAGLEWAADLIRDDVPAPSIAA
ncbi:MAG: conjugal transfer protein TrbE [Pseudomonadota bacterium]|jgi:type IV secretion system protein TrbE